MRNYIIRKCTREHPKHSPKPLTINPVPNLIPKPRHQPCPQAITLSPTLSPIPKPQTRSFADTFTLPSFAFYNSLFSWFRTFFYTFTFYNLSLWFLSSAVISHDFFDFRWISSFYWIQTAIYFATSAQKSDLLLHISHALLLTQQPACICLFCDCDITVVFCCGLSVVVCFRPKSK